VNLLFHPDVWVSIIAKWASVDLLEFSILHLRFLVFGYFLLDEIRYTSLVEAVVVQGVSLFAIKNNDWIF